MVLTSERAEKLANYFVADANKAKELMDLPADEALKVINADGFDFTVEELRDFSEELKRIAEMANSDGELSVDTLDNVAGGVVVSGAVAAALIGAGVAMFTAGVTFGYKVARDRGW